MKLARVTHVFCNRREFNEPESYVWVDDAMTQDEFEALARKAKDAYDNAGIAFQAATPPPHVSFGMPDYAKYPDKTVAEVKALHDAATANYNAWKTQKAEAQADFAHHLKAVSNGRIVQFWEHKPALDYELGWGHRHGNRPALGETAITDLPGTVETEDWL